MGSEEEILAEELETLKRESGSDSHYDSK